MGIRGVFLGGAIAAGVTAILALWFVRTDVALVFSGRRLREMLAYSVPLVPSFVAFWALSYADRWLLLRLDGLESVGLYAAGAKIAGVMLVLNFAVLTAFNPVAFKLKDRPEARRFYARAMTAYGALAATVAVALSALAPQALGLLTPAEYADGRKAVPLLALGFVFSGLSPFLSIGLHIVRKTVWVTVAATAAAVANIALNLFLIPRYGLIGAAVATAISYALMSSIFHQVTRRLYPIPFEAGRLVTLFFLLGLALGAVLGLELAGSVALAPRLAIVVLFPPALWAARVFRLREIRGSATDLAR
jgi:O-antigen/teichoic acid export membrane protein